MRCARWKSWPVLTAVLIATAAQVRAQDPRQADVLKTIDQLIEQNRKLEEQNRELMAQINALRQTIATSNPPGAVNPDTANKDPLPKDPQRSAGPQQPAPPDDKSALPEASSGNSAIFGEFNPGRGFTVARGETGELNLSGYMVARYLNQLPPG